MPDLNLKCFIPESYLTPTQWKNTVLEEKSLLLKQKFKYVPDSPKQSCTKKFSDFKNNNVNKVEILGPEFWRQTWKAEQAKVQEIIDKVAIHWELNEDQERAYRIIANHASSEQENSLKMYIGGMGGTGKSRVIKALVDMFERRKESHRFLILAPTGTAAALLGGSTYHSVLGLRGSENKNVSKSIRQVQEKLRGVSYIFIDEVSMLSCQDLYKISARI
ncbi:hypothetical protein BDZ94DRAFT_1179492, partial [Collybia nuda]